METFKDQIKQVLKKAFKVARELYKEKQFFARQKNTFGISDVNIKKANKMGFTADEYVIYDLEHNNAADYISEYERDKFRDAVRDYRIVLDNKLIFYSLIRNFARTNMIYAYKMNGRFTPLEKGFLRENIHEQLQKLGRMVYKQMSSGGGIGFCLLAFEEGEYSINRKRATVQEISSLLDTDNYLLEEFCSQGEFENEIWPFSVNTIRLITLMDKEDIIVTNALQRIGIDAERCVDNACAGGLYAVIDIQTGEMTAARSHSEERMRDDTGRIKEYRIHPVTKTPIEGIRIPDWEQLKLNVVKLHEKILFTGIFFIAWDIALLDDGFKVIEANTSCSMDLLQTFSGVRNGAVGQWMKRNEFIS